MSNILLVEGNAFIRDALRQILEARFPFLNISEVTRGENCRYGFGGFNPDVLILGLSDYERDGMEALRKLREQYPATVIVLFTDYETDEYRKKAYLNGANHIISKEKWTGNEILALMKTILDTRDIWQSDRNNMERLDNDILHRPIERRRRDRRGMEREKEYLANHPDRREWN